MTDAIETAKADWVRRVLGISPGASADTPSTAFPKQWQAALQAWETAMDEVNAQIEKLGQALRASDNKTLQDIAEFGLNAVTGNHLVPVRAALLEIARAGEQIPPALRDKTADLVDDFEDHLRKDIRVALTQSNPFKIPVPIATRLLPAVSALGKVLATA
jgi:chromosome condensin MukBEF complex kleisin-like MukF subunit